MRPLGAQGDSSGAEGLLVRKHDWESTTKKAANRSWDKVCFVTHSNESKKNKHDSYHAEDANSMIFNFSCGIG